MSYLPTDWDLNPAEISKVLALRREVSLTALRMVYDDRPEYTLPTPQQQERRKTDRFRKLRKRFVKDGVDARLFDGVAALVAHTDLGRSFERRLAEENLIARLRARLFPGSTMKGPHEHQYPEDLRAI